MSKGNCVFGDGWAEPAVIVEQSPGLSGPGWVKYAHPECAARARSEEPVPVPVPVAAQRPLPRRVRADAVRRVIEAEPPAPEVVAALWASLPGVQVSAPVLAGLRRIVDRLARLVAADRPDRAS